MLMKEVKEVVDTVSVALANGQPEEAGNVVMQEVNHALLSMGVDEAMADKIDNFIILLFIIGIALLANLICRKIILRTVAKLVRQTKATWDGESYQDFIRGINCKNHSLYPMFMHKGYLNIRCYAVKVPLLQWLLS